MSKAEARTIQSLRVISLDTTIDMQMMAGGGVRNEHPFVALVTYAGKSSDRLVGGTELIEGGPYRVFIPTNLMRRKIRELEGCSVFAEKKLDSHEKTKPIGEFTAAWVEPTDTPDGRLVLAARASGLLSHSSDPDLIDDIVCEAREGKLGFSWDIKDISFTLGAHEVFPDVRVVKFIDFKWRGATILKREVAAYSFTELAAREKEVRTSVSLDGIREAVTCSVKSVFNNSQSEEVTIMNEQELKQMQTAIAGAVKVAVEPIEAKITVIGQKVDKVVVEAADLKAKAEETKVADIKPKSDASKSDPAEPKTIGTVEDLVKGIGKQFTAAIAPLSEKLDSIVKVEPKAKAEGDTKTEPKPKSTPEVTAGAAGTESKEEPKTNVRRSHDASTLMLLARFTDDAFDDGSAEVTPDQLHAACKNIEHDKNMSAAEKDKAIGALSFQRRQMLRTAWRQGQ